jgi:arylsulfatase A-like enzyme
MITHKFVICAVWLAVGIFSVGKLTAAERPNFVFIYTDDQRWDAMSCVQKEQGEKGRFPWLQSPNLDRLASEGVRFRNAFVVLGLCAPSRAAFLTGRYGHKNGIIDNKTPFPENSITHASLMRAAGYTTGYIGKWHMGAQSGKRPGFDFSASFIGQGVYFDCPIEINGLKTPTKGWVDDVSTDFAIEFLKENKNKPFSLVLGYKTCHGPFTPPPRHAETYGEAEAKVVPNLTTPAIYRPIPGGVGGVNRTEIASGKQSVKTNLGMFRGLRAIDENVGRLLETLDQLGLSDNTVVVYSSDNGYYLGEHGLGDKRSAYDEAMRIPLIVRYPKMVAKGTTRDEMVLNIDLAPTLLELAGLPVPQEMQGKSWKRLLESTEKLSDWRSSFFYNYFLERPFGTPSVTAVRTSNAKLIKYPGHEEWTELFDLQKDPYETKNLIADPAYVELKTRLEDEYRKQSEAVDFHVPAQADELLPPDAARELPPKREPNQIVLDYRFDRVEDGKVVDQSKVEAAGILRNLTTKGGEKGKTVGVFDGQGWIDVPRTKQHDPSLRGLTLEAVVRADDDGIILARGGRTLGFCLYVKDGKPTFAYRGGDRVTTVVAGEECIGKWVTMNVRLTYERELILSVDGVEVAKKKIEVLIARDPSDGMQIGADEATQVLEEPLGRFRGEMERVWLLLGGDK